MTRETIYAALFALVSGLATFKTKSRKLKHWTDVDPSQMPALFQTQGQELAVVTKGVPTIWTLNPQLYIYCSSKADPSASPSVQMNALLDAITAALLPPPVGNSEQTLNGLVSKCRISGAIDTDEGVLGDIAVAIIPIQITVPN